MGERGVREMKMKRKRVKGDRGREKGGEGRAMKGVEEERGERGGRRIM